MKTTLKWTEVKHWNCEKKLKQTLKTRDVKWNWSETESATDENKLKLYWNLEIKQILLGSTNSIQLNYN